MIEGNERQGDDLPVCSDVPAPWPGLRGSPQGSDGLDIPGCNAVSCSKLVLSKFHTIWQPLHMAFEGGGMQQHCSASSGHPVLCCPPLACRLQGSTACGCRAADACWTCLHTLRGTAAGHLQQPACWSCLHSLQGIAAGHLQLPASRVCASAGRADLPGRCVPASCRGRLRPPPSLGALRADT